MEASVWVLGTSTGEQLDASTPVDLQHWEKRTAPASFPFTSEAAMAEATEGEQSYVMLPVRTLFGMTLGETLFLNPKLSAGKEFSARDRASAWRRGRRPEPADDPEGGEPLLLSEIAEPPAQMIDSLTQLFSKHKQVRRAFVAHIKEQADDRPNLLIGIEADGDIDNIIRAAGAVATDTLLEDEPVDICEVVDGEQGISHFLPRTSRHFMSAAGAASCVNLKAASVLSDARRRQSL